MNDDEELFAKKTPKELENEAEKSMKAFGELLDSLSSAHDKKISLWKQIYNNAVTDRRNSYIMFIDLYSMVHSNGSEHAIHGTTLAKYMERITKANDQLIKLAETIDEAVDADEDNYGTEDDLYDKFEENDDD